MPNHLLPRCLVSQHGHGHESGRGQSQPGDLVSLPIFYPTPIVQLCQAFVLCYFHGATLNKVHAGLLHSPSLILTNSPAKLNPCYLVHTHFTSTFPHKSSSRSMSSLFFTSLPVEVFQSFFFQESIHSVAAAEGVY